VQLDRFDQAVEVDRFAVTVPSDVNELDWDVRHSGWSR
jgi:hypothetical protein